MQDFCKTTKILSTPLISRRHSLTPSVWSPLLEPNSLSSLKRGWLRACHWDPGQRLRFALLACSSSGPSKLCPQGSESLRPVETNPGRTGDCRSWLDLEEQFFGREQIFQQMSGERGSQNDSQIQTHFLNSSGLEKNTEVGEEGGMLKIAVHVILTLSEWTVSFWGWFVYVLQVFEM